VKVHGHELRAIHSDPIHYECAECGITVFKGDNGEGEWIISILSINEYPLKYLREVSCKEMIIREIIE